ncbi:MAG: protein kinase [Armatimonadetes bacterium]|nr:protein kinase [Armatimonadota bacterium]
MELVVGQHILGGRYNVVEKVGEGAFGKVYKVKHNRLGRFDALKLLRRDLFHGSAFVQFCREACTAAGLGSENVVVVHDHDLDSEIGPFIIFEYCARGSLRDRLNVGGPIATEAARHVAMAVCSGLQPAHEQRIVHRDIKPENILFTSRDVPKISDFGLVHTPDAGDNAIAGTPAYMAPEQFQNPRPSPSCDIYALGAVLFEMLTGRHYLQATDVPWQGMLRPGIEELVQAVCSLNPTPPRRLNSEVPEWLDEVCMRALSKPPNERYPSAAELGLALRGPPTRDDVGSTAKPDALTCRVCGADLEAEQRFCRGCGTPARSSPSTWACANCGFGENASDNRFCTQCGYRRCAKCGKAFLPELRFCTDDGTCLVT